MATAFILKAIASCVASYQPPIPRSVKVQYISVSPSWSISLAAFIGYMMVVAIDGQVNLWNPKASSSLQSSLSRLTFLSKFIANSFPSSPCLGVITGSSSSSGSTLLLSISLLILRVLTISLIREVMSTVGCCWVSNPRLVRAVICERGLV